MEAIGIFRVDVIDSGVGIEPENHKKVFGEFNQFNRNRLQGGGTILLYYFLFKFRNSFT